MAVNMMYVLDKDVISLMRTDWSQYNISPMNTIFLKQMNNVSGIALNDLVNRLSSPPVSRKMRNSQTFLFCFVMGISLASLSANADAGRQPYRQLKTRVNCRNCCIGLVRTFVLRYDITLKELP